MANNYQPNVHSGHVNEVMMARMRKQINSNNDHTGLVQQFDAEGNVVRDYKKELEVYHQDEINNQVLINVDVKIFESFNKVQDHIVKAQVPKVKSIITERDRLEARKYLDYVKGSFNTKLIEGKSSRPKKLIKQNSVNFNFRFNFNLNRVFKPILSFFI